jgi:CheY-like chemotaxis protein
MSRIEAGKLGLKIEPVNIYSIVNEMRGNFFYQVKLKGLDYLEEIDPAVPQCLELDKVRMKQVLVNLISNGIKYTNKGYVKLIIGMNDIPVDKNKIDLIIEVEDTGVGISKENQKIIFDPYERPEGNKKNSEGAGLGLSISKGIIELMGGEISVKSEIDEGSTFTIVLKNVNVSPDQTGIGDDPGIEPSTIVFEKQKLLVVDDNQDTREVIKGYLENTAIQVLEAETGEDALKMTKKHKPDLILMDLVLTGMDGIEATRRIREDKSLSDIPVFAFTASKTDTEDVKKYKELFDRYLFKPISKANLFFELNHFLKTRPVEEKKEEIEEIGDFGTIELSSENKKMLPKIVKQLDEYRELWESVCKSNNFIDLRNFGLKVKELGDKYSMEVLSKNGSGIVSNAEMSKIKGIKEFLKQYPVLIEQLKQQI